MDIELSISMYAALHEKKSRNGSGDLESPTYILNCRKFNNLQKANFLLDCSIAVNSIKIVPRLFIGL